MATTYFGILLDGNIIEKHTLDEVNSITEVEYRVRCVKSTTWANPPTFTILNSDGSRSAFRIGDYEVLDIGEESPGTQGGHKIVTIKELRTEIIFQITTNTPGIRFFKNELVPLLKEVNEVGSWKAHQKLASLNDTYKEIEQLKAKVIILEDKLRDQ